MYFLLVSRAEVWRFHCEHVKPQCTRACGGGCWVEAEWEAEAVSDGLRAAPLRAAGWSGRKWSVNARQKTERAGDAGCFHGPAPRYAFTLAHYVSSAEVRWIPRRHYTRFQPSCVLRESPLSSARIMKVCEGEGGGCFPSNGTPVTSTVISLIRNASFDNGMLAHALKQPTPVKGEQQVARSLRCAREVVRAWGCGRVSPDTTMCCSFS